ncbi:hypothetical protein [Psychromonas antarctica]|uniref:hypothetical protein n=1 Tax=Psychromonas antarctica TaxID=67573 RepID=UPI001EE9601A|nr:hypothetical protein [Psychromonas antarctica]MCG6202242.1 hypothetical protein [Psychromonas antarctica]
MNNTPPFTLTNKLLTLVADISEKVGRLSVKFEREQNLRLRKVNRMRKLKQQGLILRIGGDKNGHWQVVTQ